MTYNFKKKYPDTDTIVCWMKSKRDREILLKQNSYRIPVRTKIRDLDKAKYFAFYQPSSFGKEGLTIKYYGEIDGEIEIKKRKDILPEEKLDMRAENDYRFIKIKNIKELENTFKSKRARRIIFINTTLDKLLNATEINDLFHGSPLEDDLWEKLKQSNKEFIRQYLTKGKESLYWLDFVAVCKKCMLNIECDGDASHMNGEDVIRDKTRDNYLTKIGWSILRYTTKQLENIDDCVDEIFETIKNRGGLVADDSIDKLINKEKKTLKKAEQNITERKNTIYPIPEERIFVAEK